ncbi:unnamed protein product [Kluyveromyces dobzhanskii CBS 2104]|uniref:Large ribosomal subunit protein mL60 n=1 Tax=Kluyveromyces dobzhanskii CBS 2104 TaxID=1427455 RepID=A0A0A8LCD1_9SACH|nr:unnamed protein product [Kluyveromyces dobzhanskii CBS 2104]
MFGAFRATQTALGGLLWKVPWRMSGPQKARQRSRLRNVDDVLSNLKLGLHLERNQMAVSEGSQLNVRKIRPGVKSLRILDKAQYFPKESEMSATDKYSVFSRYSKGYRKGIHKVPKWTKLSIRRNPRHF